MNTKAFKVNQFYTYTDPSGRPHTVKFIAWTGAGAIFSYNLSTEHIHIPRDEFENVKPHKTRRST